MNKFPSIKVISGLYLSSAFSGMRYKNRDDLMLAIMPKNTSVAGIFTKNSIVGEPVKWCKKIIREKKARALIVNAGFSNVFLGKRGKDIVENTVKAVAKNLKIKKSEVFVASTGIIGQDFDEGLIVKKIPELIKNASENAYEQAAKAILTTDTFPKLIHKTAIINGEKVNIIGFIKGSGMIAPSMATMLGFIFTDAKISGSYLQKLLSKTAEESYNCITVDSDTSTSDTILAFALGTSNHSPVKNDKDLKDFAEKFTQINQELAQLVIRDGEGITKFITINILGAKSYKMAKEVGLAIANSPLVKTALFASDPNWGRIIAGAGKAGYKLDENKITLKIGSILVAEKGAVSKNYSENDCANYMKGKDILIELNLGLGKEKATIYTCDFSYDYIKINASYRS